MKKAQIRSKWIFAFGGLLLLVSSHTLAQYPMMNGNPVARALVTSGLDQVYDNQFPKLKQRCIQQLELAAKKTALSRPNPGRRSGSQFGAG